MMYKHTQIGWVNLVIATTVILIMAFWAALNPIIYMVITLIVLTILLAIFSSLTVTGDSDEIMFYFGPGVVKKRINYDQIKSAEKVRNRWYYGWGVRWYGPGWLYNVSGLDAVELKLADGKQLRIGTDEPDQLHTFLISKIKQVK
jgi:hypothetical protein